MTIEDTTNAIAGVIPLVFVSGVAMKMTNSMFSNPANVEVKSRKKKKARQDNAYSRSNDVFKGGMSPF